MQSTVCNIPPATQKLLKQLPALRHEIYDLLVAIKNWTDWYELSSSNSNGDPGYIDVTIGLTFGEDCISWNYQTGDNSFTGGAYGHPEWFTTALSRRSNCKEIAKDVISDITNRIHELASYTGDN